MIDYSKQILDGDGKDDYARYMRTDALLSLQRNETERVHRDELLFQIVHQSTELWLKLASAELSETALQLRDGAIEEAIRLLGRASSAVHLVTGQLEILCHLSPYDFQKFRTVLGHGSGADSPGWRAVQKNCRALDAAFTGLVLQRGIDLIEIYRAGRRGKIYDLTEAMVELDERVSLWRVRHYKIATRVIGHQAIGTQGTPVHALTKLIEYKLFPQLWELRDNLATAEPEREGNGDAVRVHTEDGTRW
ncbi:tryptophan 2,3-dioxygenase family protein [Nocardia sp. NPDC051900]|uniref:tryptophan 2,3-dioxygenase family protein n=1 Tax=Nocardia sp. NPDC051900 TaxID=3364326 RepID=UPI00378E9F62